eukprot:871617-Pelagomonas_calceolata.AAC.1
MSAPSTTVLFALLSPWAPCPSCCRCCHPATGPASGAAQAPALPLLCCSYPLIHHLHLHICSPLPGCYSVLLLLPLPVRPFLAQVHVHALFWVAAVAPPPLLPPPLAPPAAGAVCCCCWLHDCGKPPQGATTQAWFPVVEAAMRAAAEGHPRQCETPPALAPGWRCPHSLADDRCYAQPDGCQPSLGKMRMARWPQPSLHSRAVAAAASIPATQMPTFL